MNCTACGFENPDGIRFCGGCARPLPGRCPRCGFDNPPSFRFCGQCATPLAEPVAPPRDPRSYTPKHVAEKILRSRSAIEGERKHVTVLFVDIVRSMELAAEVDAEEWHGVLDRFFAILAEGVHRFEGTINQFTGDGIMALFGAPIAHENHAQRACDTALRLSEALRRYGEELKRSRGLGFSARIGINSGEVVVGRIGDDLRMDYTAQGHTVGLAARMEQLAGPDRAYLTEHTARLVSGFFRLRDLGRFDLKGVRDPVRVFELEGPGPIRTRLEVSRERGFTRFVGRDSEMEILESSLAGALDGAGQVVGVVGEAGVGKSRLCHELAGRCRARGIRFLASHCPPHGRAIPFLPWIELLRSDFGVTEDDGDETARDKIAGRTLRFDEDLGEALPLLFDFLGVPDPAHPSPPFDPEARQRQLVEIIRRLVRSRSRREPAVILFEDLHWMDAGSQRFLDALIDVVSETRTLLVATFRPEYRAAWIEGPVCRQVPLRPFGPAETEAMLDALLGRDASLIRLREQIRARASGNPFFLEEIVQSLLESGVLAGARGACRLEVPVERLDVPESVQSLLAARIDRLEGAQKTVLQTAAVIGNRFGEAVLARVLEASEDAVSAPLEPLLAAGLVRPEGPDEYAFRHPLIQEVAYRSQLAERRARIHARVARALVGIHGDRLDERAALLAHHFEAAGEPLEAARWHRRAARWLRSSDLAATLTHWRRVLKLVGGLPESADTVPLALEARAVVLRLGWVLGMPSDEARELFTEGMAFAARAGDARTRTILVANYAGIQAAHGEIDEYLRLSREAVRLADETDDDALRAAVWPSLVRSHLLAGRLREALALSQAGLSAVPAEPGFGTLLGFSPYVNLLQLRANLLAYAGRWAEAASAFEQMIRIAEGQAQQVLVDSGCSDYAWWAALFRDAPTALRNARRGLTVAERLGNQMARVYAFNALGVAELCARRPAEAAAALEQARRIAGEMHTGQEAGILTLAHLAEAHLGLGEPDLALELAETAVSEACERRTAATECFTRLVHARILLSTGAARNAEVPAALDRALALAEETGARAFEPFIRVERARLAEIARDDAGRERELRQARDLFAAIGVPVETA